MKRPITLLLLLCMFASLFSGMAFAAEETPETAEPNVTDVSADAEIVAEEAPAADVQPVEAVSEESALTSVEAVAAAPAAEVEASAEAAAAEDGKQQSDLKSVLSSNLYVEANNAAALASKVVVQFDKLGSNGTLYLPGKVDAAQLCFSWDDAGITVSKDGVTYASGTAPVAPAGSSVTYKLAKGRAFVYVTVKTVQGSVGVEPMFLEIDESLGTIAAMNADEDHETVCYGKALYGSIDKSISIKGRGNSTWGFSKKPYNITFYKAKNGDPYAKKDKTELIKGVKAKKWSLIANYLDNSLLRNKIAMDLANQLGIGLETRFVDVWMNGEYLGNYLLTPKNDYQAPDGGYALENDNYLESEDPQFQIPGMYEIGAALHDDGYYNRITVKDIGDDAADAGLTAADIEAYFDTAWSALLDYDSETYQNYFDMDSWAKMFLMYEVSKTYDCYAGSLLMHRDGLTENDKLIAGPAWDYDVSFGRTLHKFLVGISEPMQLNAEGWYNDSIGLISVDKPISLLQELGKHASFMQHVAKVYNENKAIFEDLPANVTRQQEVLRASALMNNVKWGTHSLCAEYLIAPNTMSLLGSGKYALQYEVTLTWDNYVNNLREYCTKRVMWLSDHLYAEAPVGAIEKQVMADGSIVLKAALTAGNTANTYQWQSSADGKTWTDIAGATAATYTPDAETLGTVQYRCVVSNAGAVITTTHGGNVKTYAQTTLDPATVTVRMAETALEEGTLTLVMNGAQIGDYDFAQYNGGWSIRNANGKYLKPSGRTLVLSNQPFAWTLKDGVFTARTTAAVTLLGKLVTLGYLWDVNLTVNNGALAVTLASGTPVAFLKQVAE